MNFLNIPLIIAGNEFIEADLRVLEKDKAAVFLPVLLDESIFNSAALEPSIVF